MLIHQGNLKPQKQQMKVHNKITISNCGQHPLLCLAVMSQRQNVKGDSDKHLERVYLGMNTTLISKRTVLHKLLLNLACENMGKVDLSA